MPYEQDESGQWWYVAQNYRSRAYPSTCEECGATFYARRSDRIRFCSRRSGQLGERHPHWKGGRHLQKGYVLVLVADDHLAAPMRDLRGYVPEHRMLMAVALGRALGPRETVHHINGDKTDNRLQNLELRLGPHGPGVRYQCAACGSLDINSVALG
jgi:HNH endonuclease